VKQSRRDAGAENRMRCSMGVLAVRAMRKDSARDELAVRRGIAILRLRLRCWFRAGGQAPLKRPGRQMEIDARWFLAIPDNKRYAKAR
jgi:hypothetical protein